MVPGPARPRHAAGGDGEVSSFRVVDMWTDADIGHATYAPEYSQGNRVFHHRTIVGQPGEIASLTAEAQTLRPRRHQRMPVPRGQFFEDGSFLLVLRSLPLGGGYRARMAVAAARRLARVDVRPEVRGREQVAVAAGDSTPG